MIVREFLERVAPTAQDVESIREQIAAFEQTPAYGLLLASWKFQQDEERSISQGLFSAEPEQVGRTIRANGNLDVLDYLVEPGFNAYRILDEWKKDLLRDE